MFAFRLILAGCCVNIVSIWGVKTDRCKIDLQSSPTVQLGATDKSISLLQQGVHNDEKKFIVDVDLFNKIGYTVLQNVFPGNVVDKWVAKINSYVHNHGPHAARFNEGWTIIDFDEDPYLVDLYEAIHTNKMIHGALEQIFGTNMGKGKDQYRYVDHNNINVKTTVGWHKDRLNDIYRQYEVHSPWSTVNGEKMKIMKVAIYLEDHSHNNESLRVIPGSHMSEFPEETNVRYLHPRKGDIIVFDQRITHRGSDKHDASMPKKNDHRIMLQMGYGMNNIFSDEFEKGTRMRQKMYLSSACKYHAYGKCATELVKRDLRLT